MINTQQKQYFQEKLSLIIESLKKNYRPQKIILFGSMLDPKASSNDIDLFLVKNTSLKRLGDRAEEARGCIPFPEIPMDLIVYTPEEVNKYQGRSVMLHEIFKGKVLYG